MQAPTHASPHAEVTLAWGYCLPAINGRLEALRRNTLGFRNLTTTDCAHCSTAAHSTLS
jgi:hypothetical protein